MAEYGEIDAETLLATSMDTKKDAIQVSSTFLFKARPSDEGVVLTMPTMQRDWNVWNCLTGERVDIRNPDVETFVLDWKVAEEYVKSTSFVTNVDPAYVEERLGYARSALELFENVVVSQGLNVPSEYDFLTSKFSVTEQQVFSYYLKKGEDNMPAGYPVATFREKRTKLLSELQQIQKRKFAIADLKDMFNKETAVKKMIDDIYADQKLTKDDFNAIIGKAFARQLKRRLTRRNALLVLYEGALNKKNDRDRQVINLLRELRDAQEWDDNIFTDDYDPKVDKNVFDVPWVEVTEDNEPPKESPRTRKPSAAATSAAAAAADDDDDSDDPEHTAPRTPKRGRVSEESGASGGSGGSGSSSAAGSGKKKGGVWWKK